MRGTASTPSGRVRAAGSIRPATPARRRTIERDSVETPSRDSQATGRTGGSGVWCRRDNGGSHFLFRFRHSSVDLLDRLLDLRPPPIVGRGGELPLPFRFFGASRLPARALPRSSVR